MSKLRELLTIALIDKVEGLTWSQAEACAAVVLELLDLDGSTVV